MSDFLFDEVEVKGTVSVLLFLLQTIVSVEKYLKTRSNAQIKR